MKRRFWRKLLAACIMIAFLYTFIAGLVYAMKNNQIMQAELLNQRRAFMEQAKTRLDMKLNVAFNYVAQLRVNPNVLAYAREQEMDYYIITSVFNELKNNMNAFTNIGYQIDLVKQGSDLVITPYSTMSREQYYAFMNFDADNAAWFEEFERSGALPSTAMVQYKEEARRSAAAQEYGDPSERGPLVAFVRHEALANREGIMVVISFHEDQFFPEQSSERDSFRLLYGKEWIGTAAEGRTAWHRAEEILAGLKENAAQAELRLDGRQVYAAKSASLGKLHYVYSVPDHAWSGSLGGIARSLAPFYAGMTLLGIMISLFAANKLYKPVRGAVSSFRREGTEEAADEFAFIRESAARIQEANDQLREMLRHHKLPLKKKFMRDLILGLLPAEQAEAGVKRHELDWLRGQSVVVVLEFLEEEQWSEEYPLETMLEIKAQALRIVMEHLEAYGPGDSVELDHLHYAVLLKDGGIPLLRKLVLEAVAGVEERFAIRMAAAAGCPVASGASLKDSYRMAARLLEQRQVHDRHAVVTFAEMSHTEGVGSCYPLDAERELTICVLQGKPEETVMRFNRIWEEHGSRAAANGEAAQLFLYAMITTISRICQHINKTASEVFPGGIPFQHMVRSGRDSHEQLLHMRQLLEQLAAHIRERSKEQDQSLAGQILAYMHGHYHYDLSLTDMAGQFNLSPNYISQLIKEKTGESFKDYLNEYRVKQAKRIMDEHADMKIHDIAGMAGWSNVNTFIRVFKKYEGVTPGQYRQQDRERDRDSGRESGSDPGL
ncbi:helix-turn-helix domain-containing protein [Paenibacillus sp. YN15]|uniref:helix-turn-helix transcriptional regulator n=1 Tax=Paenibacillus sp. YN15 TaxID=1742774 RepID=UPI000DCDF553|nr:helix-turn-helix domain-containing protein [Paenibacillus sp. YN15]RAU91862.1 hypothetical protein DQG13_28625 [Paenibacillus sp. YN15]